MRKANISLFFILTYFTANAVLAQFSTGDQKKIDSLNAIIANKRSHDTSILSAYVNLSDIFYVSNPDTLIPICKIVEKKANLLLSKQPSVTVQKSINASLASALNNIGVVHQIKGEMNLALAYYLSGASRRQILSPEESKRLKRIALLTFAFIYIQLILGASVRHTHHLHVAYLHMLFALFVVVHVLLLILKISHFHLKEKSLLTPAILMGVFTFVQILLGVGSFVTTLMLERTSASPPLVEVAFTAAHQSMGALILGLAFYVVIKVLQTPAEILQSKK